MNLQEVLNKWNIKCDLNTILSLWNEPHRYYHSVNHLNDLINQINENKSRYSEKEYEQLLIAALFHDCIYDPMRSDNEEKSADFFIQCCGKTKNYDILQIKEIILDTKNHQPTTNLSRAFTNYDLNIIERDFQQLLEWEMGISEEYKGYKKEEYKKARLSFLESLIDRYVDNRENLRKLIDWVKNN